MARLITGCPSCKSSSVQVTKIECRGCGTKFEGDFEIPRLLKLAPEDLKFVEEFVLTSGSLKEMAKRMDISYPTIRNKLNAVIEEIERMSANSKSDRDKILSALEKGTITAKEAAKKLREV